MNITFLNCEGEFRIFVKTVFVKQLSCGKLSAIHVYWDQVLENLTALAKRRERTSIQCILQTIASLGKVLRKYLQTTKVVHKQNLLTHRFLR